MSEDREEVQVGAGHVVVRAELAFHLKCSQNASQSRKQGRHGLIYALKATKHHRHLHCVITPLLQLPGARPKALAPPTLPNPKSFLEMLKLNYNMPAVIHLVTAQRSICPPPLPSCGWTFDGFLCG